MRISLRFRLSTACAATVFAATGGVTGMQTHPLSMHGAHTESMIALELQGPSVHSDTDQAGQHTGHSQHGSSEDCTCVGPCQSGVGLSLPDAGSPAIVHDRVDHEPAVSVVVFAVREDPASYLFPLPNGPPQRV